MRNLNSINLNNFVSAYDGEYGIHQGDYFRKNEIINICMFLSVYGNVLQIGHTYVMLIQVVMIFK